MIGRPHTEPTDFDALKKRVRANKLLLKNLLAYNTALSDDERIVYETNLDLANDVLKALAERDRRAR